ncbi:MAG TPA: amino acid adenylation domain-containing protein [Pseudosphingobacterium sp.]|nr:amino acid adenylation domain-containing protein [Pseudosphingobacterium sp.]
MQTQGSILKNNVQSINEDEVKSNFTNVVELIEELAVLFPDKIALVDEGKEHSYRMLNQQANQLAHYLREIGIRPHGRVAVCLKQSADRIIAFLAILKTGAAYLPIDGQLPESRIQMMVEDAEVDLVLTHRHYWSKVNGFAKTTIDMNDIPLAAKLSELRSDNLKQLLAPNSCAYIIYTSGSSGKPKGVMISHKSFSHFVSHQAKVLEIVTGSKTLQFASPSFDAAVIDIWVPLSQGATVFLYPDNKIVGEPLLDFIVAHDIDTVPLLPPAVLASLPFNKPIGSLHTIAIGGEASVESTIRNWYKRVKLINSYGPTETTVAVTNHRFEHETNPRMIGSALPAVDLWVLDEHLQKVPAGTVGELYIGGPQLALGYINRPEDMEKAFIKVPEQLLKTEEDDIRLYRTGDRVIAHADGMLEYVGRGDEQVKIRGYRIELAEVEHGIAKLPQVAKAAVLAHRPEEGLPSLIAFVQPAAKTDATAFKDIRAKLQQLMPIYMVPEKIVVLDTLPLNHAGKVDKSQLQVPAKEDKKTTVKRKGLNLTEQVMQIWKELLGLPEVSIDADFFDLGGHSLLLAQLHVRLPETVQARVSLPELYTYSTIISFVEEVERRLNEVELSQKIKAEQTIQELLKDAELPFDFTVEQVPDAELLANPKHIFLTGVTGFVGSHLLVELLLQHPQATIHCLIRAEGLIDAWKRIDSTFKKFKLAFKEEYGKRIIPYEGDLSLPNFGMKASEYEQLLHTIDVIYHSGSSVSYVQPYELIKKPNIDGLYHILHLAVNRRVKHLVLLSSMGVFSWGRPFTGKTWMYEDDSIEQNLPAVSRDLGYIKSKWVMESIAEKAKNKGLPIINFRLGFAVCHSTSGATVRNQWWGALIRSCAELGSFPLVMGLKDELTTVDYMCKAIAHIGKKEEAIGQNFHLSPLPENDVSLTDFCAKINEYFDLDLKGMEYHEWLSQWRYNTDLPIYPLLSLFTEDIHEGKCLVEAYENTYYYDRRNTQRFLDDINLKPPAFTKQVMAPYLKFIEVL